MKYILHVAYNLDFKGTPKTEQEKKQKKKRKEYIQSELKKQLFITVDVIKKGFGTANTGNVSRIFFENYEIAAKVTIVDVNFLKRINNILLVLTRSQKLDCNKFQNYALQTAEMCVTLYSWYKMPPSIHKVLIHESEIIASFDLPIGFYSEEPQKCSNKVFRKARSLYSKMINSKQTNLDT